MNHKRFILAVLSFVFVVAATCTTTAIGQIPNQLARDLVAGSAPSPEEVAKIEKEVAGDPNNMELVRKLGKAYFFQFFDEGDKSAIPKSFKTLERVLTIEEDEPETLAYMGSLHILRAMRLEKGDAAKQKASYDRGFELIKQAEKLAPRNGAVMSVASGSYMWLPDSYGMARHVVQVLEGMRKGMGPNFKKFSHHGQQRILLTLGQAYVKVGQSEKAVPLFEEALAVNATSREAALLRTELKKLGK